MTRRHGRLLRRLGLGGRLGTGVTIHALMSAAESFVPTPSERIRLAALTRDGVADRAFLRGVDLLPLLHLRGVLRTWRCRRKR